MGICHFVMCPRCQEAAECHSLVGRKRRLMQTYGEKQRNQEVKIEVVPKDNWVSVFHPSVYLSNYSTYLPRATMDRWVRGKEIINEHKGTCKLSALRKGNSG